MASTTTNATKTAGIFGVLILFVAGVAAYSTFGSTQAYDESKTHSGANISTITVRVPHVDVNIVPTDSNEITAHFSGRGERDHYTLSLNEQNNGLEVIVDNPGRHFLPNLYFGQQQLTLEVQVPKHQYELFTVDSSSGNIRLSTLEAKLLQLTASSGDIEFSHFKGETLKVSASSGDVKIGDVQANTELQTNSGDIEARDIKGTLGAASSSGSLTLSQIEGDSTLTTNSGDVRLNGLVATHLKTTSSSGDQDLEKISGAEIDSRSSSGDITLSVLDQMQNMQINTSSGDAKLSLPASSAFALDFNTSSGDSKIDFPITYSSQDKHSMHGMVGSGGPLLDVHTSSGSLSLLKK
jgi:DUF4097 and DUF4098 domain-containing protein YvlB